MRHRNSTKKLGRLPGHRKALMANLATSLFISERITTTLPKAKALRPVAERLITTAKRDTLHARRMAGRTVRDAEVLRKLFATLGPRYAERPGGYTRILRLGYRRGDSAEMAIIELVDRPKKTAAGADAGKATKRKLVERDEPSAKKGSDKG